MPLTHRSFGTTSEGVAVELYTLTNSTGLSASIMTYGATLTTLYVPDRDGTLADVVLGFDTLEPYLKEHPYFGSLVGRYSNRIADGRFMLNGTSYELARNDGPNHLHGGPQGFHRAVWQVVEAVDSTEPSLKLNYLSRDGEEGFPGNLNSMVTYTLSANHVLEIDYLATTDRDTIVSLTNHSYFNLAGSGNILDHEAQIDAARFVPINSKLIPLGELRSVQGTPMDFTTSTRIGARIANDDEQLQNGLGYDHCWVPDLPAGTLRRVARVYDPGSGRVLEVSTTQPGIQFYTGNMLDGSVIGKSGQQYGQHSGLCLESQALPDAPNQSQFPSAVLRIGDTYHHITRFQFAVQTN